MPMFDYSCKACNHKFEDLVKHADDLVPCPKCGSEDVIKHMGAPSFDLRGPGFYSVDYGPTKPKNGQGDK